MFTQLVIIALLATVLHATLRSVRMLRETTVYSASWWAVAGVAGWLVTSVCGLFEEPNAGWLDVAHYAVAVVLLCPMIAVLGARKPSANVWAAFVLVPLVLVSMWPVAASPDVFKGRPLELETPTIIGFGLVLVMGAGNYFGTLSGFPVFLLATSLVCLVLPMWSHVPEFFPKRQTARLIASILTAWSVLNIALRRSGNDQWTGPKHTKLWLDFIDLYGMVWGKRVMDRINEAADHDQWGCRLELDGFVPASDLGSERVGLSDSSQQETSGASQNDRRFHVSDAALRNAEPFLRWILKRFVTGKWINNRIDSPADDLPDLGN